MLRHLRQADASRSYVGYFKKLRQPFREIGVVPTAGYHLTCIHVRRTVLHATYPPLTHTHALLDNINIDIEKSLSIEPFSVSFACTPPACFLTGAAYHFPVFLPAECPAMDRHSRFQTGVHSLDGQAVDVFRKLLDDANQYLLQMQFFSDYYMPCRGRSRWNWSRSTLLRFQWITYSIVGR